jgi:hypothetical protein
MPNQPVSDRIRNIFLHDRPNVSIRTARRLFGWEHEQFEKAISAREIEVLTTGRGRSVPREELIALALQIWSAEAIHAALGDQAAMVLPEAQRIAELRARIPQYQIAMLHYLARRDQTTLSAVLTRELDDLASSESAELSVNIPGFAEALAWPELPGCWLA